MLYFLTKSAICFLSNPYLLSDKVKNAAVSMDLAALISSMASIQLVLTALAVTNYHVQIITRVSSGYPLWYWWLANLLSDRRTAGTGKNIVIFMIMYASIQGALFASFLPPA